MPVMVVKDDNRYEAGLFSGATFDQYLTAQLTTYRLSKR